MSRSVHCILAAVLAFLLAFCAVACVVSAYALTVNLWVVALWCAGSAALCGVCFRHKWGLAVPIVLTAAAAVLLVFGQLLPGCRALLYFISKSLNEVHGWKLLRFGADTADSLAGYLTPTTGLLAALLTALCARCVCLQKSGWVAFFWALPSLVLCLLLPQSPPKVLWVVGLFFALALILITDLPRRQGFAQGLRAMAFTVLPIILAVAVLFICVSPVAYDADRYANALLQSRAFRTLWASVTGERLGAQLDPQQAKVDLTKAGPQNPSEFAVLYVTTDYRGQLYIRGSGLDTYDGLYWTDGGGGKSLGWPDQSKLQSIGEVILTSRYANRMLYVPYYPTSMNLSGVTRGVVNETELTYYTVACGVADPQKLRELYPNPGENRHSASVDMMAQCTELPAATRRWAQKLVKEIIPAGTVSYYHKAQAIGQYVRAAAVYDMNTRAMPNVNQDFVQWFLEQSDTGYCIHFASAAVVLLQAAGIPARYVSGYLVTPREATTAVRQSDAHAWAEYWLPGFGWTVLEATPAAPAAPEETQPAPVPEETAFALPKWVLPALAALGVLSLAAGVVQWPVRVALGRRKLRKGGFDRQVLSRWALMERYCAALKIAPDRALFRLAQKAKFSPHPITAADVARFDGALAALEKKLKKRSLWVQLKDRLIRGLY